MRAFIALELPTDFADDVAAMARRLSASLDGRFLDRSTYHLTLAFLGDIDDAEASRAMDALDAACSGATPVPLAPDSLGK
ncbi:MAG: 2'-5' RNA ligase family protein, partial [Adlercreutzia sp.]|nr:2'-5' RNA ligase family protein [Adlercreutzia sp.]